MPATGAPAAVSRVASVKGHQTDAPIKRVVYVGLSRPPDMMLERVTRNDAGSGLPVKAVLAATKEMGIGMNGSLPWKLPKEMAFFKQLTVSTRDPLKVICLFALNTL